MSKLKKTIITLCLSIGAVIIISIGAYAAIKHTIVDQLIEKNASTCNKELKLTTGNIEDPIEKEAAGIYNSEMAAKYETALENGYIYQCEMFLDDNNLHSFRFVKTFAKEELDGAYFEDDHAILNIQGKRYYTQFTYAGYGIDADPEFPGADEWTVLLRVFTEENWKEMNEIRAVEQFKHVKEDVVIPISESNVALFGNEDNSLVREFTEDELGRALISDNGVFVKIDDETYVVNYNMTDNDAPAIMLRTIEGYGGDAGFLDPEKYAYYSLNEWREE